MRKIFYKTKQYTLANSNGRTTFLVRSDADRVPDVFVFRTNDQKTALCMKAVPGVPVEVDNRDVAIILQDAHRRAKYEQQSGWQ